MTKNEKIKNLVANDVFNVANMITHYNIEVSDNLEDFMMDWFSKELYEPTKYSFDELKEFAIDILNIVAKNPCITKEPMVKFPLEELQRLITKAEKEIMVEKTTQVECWNDMDNINAVGGLSGFLKKHQNNPKLLEVQAVIRAILR